MLATGWIDICIMRAGGPRTKSCSQWFIVFCGLYFNPAIILVRGENWGLNHLLSVINTAGSQSSAWPLTLLDEANPSPSSCSICLCIFHDGSRRRRCKSANIFYMMKANSLIIIPRLVGLRMKIFANIILSSAIVGIHKDSWNGCSQPTKVYLRVRWIGNPGEESDCWERKTRVLSRRCEWPYCVWFLCASGYVMVSLLYYAIADGGCYLLIVGKPDFSYTKQVALGQLTLVDARHLINSMTARELT